MSAMYQHVPVTDWVARTIAWVGPVETTVDGHRVGLRDLAGI